MLKAHMQKKKTNASNYNELTILSLICTILALNTWNSLLEAETKSVDQNNSFTQNLLFQPMNFLYIYLSVLNVNAQIYHLTSQLLQTLRITFVSNNFKINSQWNENELLRQYLRKFNFFYCYYYINTYPNDISLLSVKKLNMLAIRSLFLIHSI